MRGKPGANGAVVMGERIIPAHAGQTPRPRATPTARTDHPRACGANSALRPSNILQSGSSPRMRGKPRLCTAAISVLRIIPAHAGQTCGGRRGPACSADHPRACGANLNAYSCVLAARGSSPRMRGKPHRATGPFHAVRIIPAHAGQTGERPSNARPLADHPRACGANLQLVEGFGGSFFGSSPRMRGKRQGSDGRRPETRIIPAHAGQTAHQ